MKTLTIFVTVFSACLLFSVAAIEAEISKKEEQAMAQSGKESVTLPALPYKEDALDPFISVRAVSFHYDKHHKGYMNKLRELVEGTDLAGLSLEDVIDKTAGHPDKAAIFNNAAQVWNHTFYWNSISPTGGGRPSGVTGKRIEADFGSYENFAKQFADAGLAQFGSGWVWLVDDGGRLKILKTSNAENPMSQKKGRALLVIDVWEHAYYLDYQNRRSDYLKTVIEKLINWEFAEKNLSQER